MVSSEGTCETYLSSETGPHINCSVQKLSPALNWSMKDQVIQIKDVLWGTRSETLLNKFTNKKTFRNGTKSFKEIKWEQIIRSHVFMCCSAAGERVVMFRFFVFAVSKCLVFIDVLCVSSSIVYLLCLFTLNINFFPLTEQHFSLNVPSVCSVIEPIQLLQLTWTEWTDQRLRPSLTPSELLTSGRNYWLK